MRLRFLLLSFSVVCFTVSALSQSADDFNEVLDIPLFYSEMNPESPVGIFSLDLPMYFPSKTTVKHQLSAAFTMANSWHPQARFMYPKNLTPRHQRDLEEIYMSQRPEYFELMGIETDDKLFQSDGVLNHLKLTYLTTWTSKHSLVVNFNIHQLTGGRSPINFFVSDGFIEDFHSNVAIEDNYGRRLYPFNRASIQFDDETGKSFRIDKGDVFASVVDAHYYRQLFSRANEHWRFDSQLGAHVSIPLNEFHPYLIPGLSAAVRMDLRLGLKSSLSYAVQGGLTDQTSFKLGEGVRAIDNQYRKHWHNYLALNLMSKKKNTLVIGLLVNYQDALMKGGSYSWDQTDYEEIGIDVLKEGDVWEGEPIEQEFYLSKTTPAALYYYSLKTYFMLGFHKNGNAFTVYCGEDLFSVNNAPDIQFSFQYRFSPFKKKD